MDHCEEQKSVTREVKDFMVHVSGVQEESITDFLLWKWALIDNKLKSIKVSSFTKQEESTISGADFEMEVWLVGRKVSYPLVFQAKKFVKPYDAYVSKLRYPKNTKNQMNTLLKYASANSKIPFYAFYTLPDGKTADTCLCCGVANCGIFVALAEDVEAFADGKHGRRVSKNDLLRVSTPFHCIFCCPTVIGDNFNFDSRLGPNAGNDRLPEYVRYLLNTDKLELSKYRLEANIEEYNLDRFRHIAVYDMREIW